MQTIRQWKWDIWCTPRQTDGCLHVDVFRCHVMCLELAFQLQGRDPGGSTSSDFVPEGVKGENSVMCTNPLAGVINIHNGILFSH